MGTIALAHDQSSRHPFLINFSKLLLGPEVSYNRKLNCSLQAVYNRREAEVGNRVSQWPILISAGIVCFSISWLLGRFKGFNLL